MFAESTHRMDVVRKTGTLFYLLAFSQCSGCCLEGLLDSQKILTEWIVNTYTTCKRKNKSIGVQLSTNPRHSGNNITTQDLAMQPVGSQPKERGLREKTRSQKNKVRVRQPTKTALENFRGSGPAAGVWASQSSLEGRTWQRESQ